MRYLLITHIPFARRADGSVFVDRLWAEDLKGLSGAMGRITVAAPELDPTKLQSWGTGFGSILPEDWISFTGLPVKKSRWDVMHGIKLRSALRKAVQEADLVHTSNLFEPQTELYFAHDYATRRGVKTLFVVAEDFYDMLGWEWVRTAPGKLQHWRRRRTLRRLDAKVRQRVSNSSLTFLHTPAAVSRYRLDASNAIAIRQPVHEREDVIEEAALEKRLTAAKSGTPLRLVTASRMQPLKGLDLLVRAVAILESRGIAVEATLYGDGPQLPIIQSLAQRLNIAQRVRLPGPLSQGTSLREGLERGDVFLMPHLTTDFGRAFFDAIAAALPVIAFRSVASEDTVRDGVDGLLTPNADPEGLANAIARLHCDRALLASTSRAARTRALNNTRTVWNALRAGWVRELFPG